ncbi:MAG: DNA polymerase III subunit delta' [Gammaproteobacteria bacterium]|nr:DNA polymerase III subunit delta' [Gammaproteobacteria bacterium]
MNADNPLLPWLATDWQRLAKRQRNGRLPHAMLISGKSGVGKSSFSRFAAQTFLCKQPGPEGYCGQCESCLLFAAGTHPDFLPVGPAEKKTIIGIDQVRELIDELELTPQCSQRKVAVIDPADSMNSNAANCLLKTLEEPASSDLILLVCTTPGYLPATIRSRCQSIQLSVDNHEQALAWLLAKGLPDAADCLELTPEAPLKALAFADGRQLKLQNELLADLLALIHGREVIAGVAAKYAGEEARSLLVLLLGWFAAAIKHKMGCAKAVPGSASETQIPALAKAYSLDKLFNIYNKINNLNVINSSSFKTQTVLEGIFADMRLNHLN